MADEQTSSPLQTDADQTSESFETEEQNQLKRLLEEKEEELRRETEKLSAIVGALTVFLESGDWRKAGAKLISSALKQTDSDFGFIGVLVEGPVLRILAHEGIVWDKNINRAFYEQAMKTYQEAGYLEFTNFENLFGKVITTGKAVVSNRPETDPRSGGCPAGHPGIRHFLGVPLLREGEVVGLIGVANRAGGYTGEEQCKIETLSQAAGVLFDSYRRREREIVLERRRTEAEEREKVMCHQLQQAEKMRALGNMIAGVAHELNNPLTAILGYAELMQEASRTRTEKADAEAIAVESQRCVKIVQDLLIFSRKCVPKRESCRLNQIIESAFKLCASQLSLDKIDVSLDLEQGLPPILGDPNKLEQLCMNIINNSQQALRGVSPSRRISVITRREETAIRIVFQDNGPGIAKENLQKIFDPFFTTKEVGEGTGLGLSICYGIVEDHGGKIWAEHDPGGAIFIVELPIFEPEQPGLDNSIPSENRGRTPKSRKRRTKETLAPVGIDREPHVLVVDDEESIRTVLSRSLKNFGFHVAVAASVDEAIEILDRQIFDLMIVDLKMPGKDGKELFHHLMQHRPELTRRFILSSGDVVSAEAREFTKKAGIRILEKPYKQSALKHILLDTLKLNSRKCPVRAAKAVKIG